VVVILLQQQGLELMQAEIVQSPLMEPQAELVHSPLLEQQIQQAHLQTAGFQIVAQCNLTQAAIFQH
jgi:hypothetical protein